MPNIKPSVNSFKLKATNLLVQGVERVGGTIGEALPPMLREYRGKLFQKMLVVAAGVSKVVYDVDLNVPSRWGGLIDSLQTSSGLVYSTISGVNKDVDEEVQRWETRFRKSLGSESLYDEEDIVEVSERFSDFSFKT
ncbi:MAG: hypothetical protein ABEJ93_02910 [Candidatus Nanohalobium sp.]